MLLWNHYPLNLPLKKARAMPIHTAHRLTDAASRIILGKEHAVRLALACILARGHLLIEDIPGVGKTTVAHVLARLLGLQFQRIQFTSDMLPADIVGVSVFDQREGAFRFHPGPVFAQLVLAGEADPEEARRQLLRGIEQLSQVFQDPDSRTHLGAATDAVVEGRFYQAMRSLRNLLPREARLLGVRPAG